MRRSLGQHCAATSSLGRDCYCLVCHDRHFELLLQSFMAPLPEAGDPDDKEALGAPVHFLPGSMVGHVIGHITLIKSNNFVISPFHFHKRYQVSHLSMPPSMQKCKQQKVFVWRLSRVCNLLWSRVGCPGYCPKATTQEKASASENRTIPSTGNLSLVYDKSIVFAQLYEENSQQSVLGNRVSVNTGPGSLKWAPMRSGGCLWKWDMDNHQRSILHTQS